MKVIVIILFFSLGLNAQQKFDADGHIKHFYASAFISGTSAEILYKKTKLQGLSSLVGALIGITVNTGKEIIWDGYMHRGVKSLGDGISGSMGAISAGMVHRVTIDFRYKKKQRQLENMRRAHELYE